MTSRYPAQSPVTANPIPTRLATRCRRLPVTMWRVCPQKKRSAPKMQNVSRLRNCENPTEMGRTTYDAAATAPAETPHFSRAMP